MTAVLRARPLVVGRIRPCGAIHWTGAMHLVHADSREEAWRYTPSASAVLKGLYGDTWDGAVSAALVAVKSGVDIVRRQNPDVEITTTTTATGAAS
jgi:hypothetical protein